MAPYPSKSEIEELASHLASSDQSGFFNRVSPNVVWDVMGMLISVAYVLDA
jgi:hypothetical protein